MDEDRSFNLSFSLFPASIGLGNPFETKAVFGGSEPFFCENNQHYIKSYVGKANVNSQDHKRMGTADQRT